MIRSTMLWAFAAAGAAALTGAPAAAAPQVLGLVASAGVVPLVCDDAGCRAELSAFCLQQPRANPEPSQAYRPAAGAAITLVGTTATGETVRLPGAGYLDFVSERGFTAVAATLPRATLAELGLVAVAVEIGPDVSLLPETPATDLDPQTAEEVALATGAIRRAGAPFFDAPGESADAIRLTNAMINALPETGRARSDSDGSLWRRVAATPTVAPADPGGAALARSLHAACRDKVDVTHHVYSMRDCLEGSHDRLVVRTNIDFWASLGGS